MYKNILLSSITLLTFTACSYKQVEVYQKEDQLLNCNKLTTKIADLKDLNSHINKNTGIEEKSLITWIFWPPLGGYNQINASKSRSKIDQRLNYLLELKDRNNCEPTNQEIQFSIDKGRFF